MEKLEHRTDQDATLQKEQQERGRKQTDRQTSYMDNDQGYGKSAWVRPDGYSCMILEGLGGGITCVDKIMIFDRG